VTRTYALLAVEGPSDQAVVSRALRLLGFTSFGGSITELDRLWRRRDEIVPTYPPKSGNLYERLPMPSILHTDALSVAVFTGGGSKLVTQVRALLTNHDLDKELRAFGVIADADANDPHAVAKKFRDAFEDIFPGFPDRAGEVAKGPPALGTFVFPDNSRQGVVEHLVHECGGTVYPDLMSRAQAYVASFEEADRSRAKWAPFDEEKAVVAAVASLLKPGKTNTVSLSDDQWVSEQTRNLPMLAGLLAFSAALLGPNG
jgi:hypothetical protein